MARQKEEEYGVRTLEEEEELYGKKSNSGSGLTIKRSDKDASGNRIEACRQGSGSLGWFAVGR